MTKGNNAVVIAVIDEGVTSDHTDLPNTRQVRLIGSNFGDGNSNDLLRRGITIMATLVLE